MPSIQITAFCANETDARLLGAVLEAAYEAEGLPVATFENPAGLGWKVDLYAEGDDEDAEALKEAVAAHAARQDLAVEINGKVLADADWVLMGLEGLGAVRAGRFVVHGIHARDALRTGDIGLQVEASRAFGTGHHGTTEGCLTMIDWLLKRFEPANALDVGTGTGVLAIGIARLRPITVLATDIDAVSVQIARENAAINGVARAIRVFETGTLTHPAIRAGGPYDLVVANILAGPLIDLAPSMSEATSERGAIILSGLLVRQERAVLARYRQLGFVPMRRLHLEGWSTLLLGRG